MYEIGSLIFYGSTGVCLVEGVKQMKSISGSGNVLYYVLRPLSGGDIIYSPALNPKVFMRPVLSKETALALFSVTAKELETRAAELENTAIKTSAELGRLVLSTHNAFDLLVMVYTLRQRKKELAERRRHLGQVDEHFLAKGEALLFGELSVVLSMEKETVASLLAEKGLLPGFIEK